jgi:hypothetical protein
LNKVSLPVAIWRISFLSSWSRPNGGADHPTSTCRQRCGRPSGRGRLGGRRVLLDEGSDDAMGGRAVGGIGDGLAVGIRDRLDRRVSPYVPIEIAGAGDLCADDAHRRAFRVGAQHAHDADTDADLDGAGDHRLLGLPCPLRIEELERQTMLLEDSAALADFGYAGVPKAALADCELQRLLGRYGTHHRGSREPCASQSCGDRPHRAFLPATAFRKP